MVVLNKLYRYNMVFKVHQAESVSAVGHSLNKFHSVGPEIAKLICPCHRACAADASQVVDALGQLLQPLRRWSLQRIAPCGVGLSYTS